jgi:integrase
LVVRKVKPVVYTAQALGKMFRELGTYVGVPIRPKDGRPSFGQALKDHGVPIEDISIRMRHTSVQTTQKYYVELRPDKDFRALDRYWNNEPNPMCEKVRDVPKSRN